MKIFDWITEIQVKKRKWNSFTDEDKKSFNVFIINRFLSMNPDYLELVNYIQQYTNGQLKPQQVYECYREIIPVGKTYSKYIRGKRSKKYDKLLIGYLTKYYECSSKDVEDYLELLSKNEVREILEKYGVEPKTIKKIWK